MSLRLFKWLAIMQITGNEGEIIFLCGEPEDPETLTETPCGSMP
jgi:hypothetical protein